MTIEPASGWSGLMSIFHSPSMTTDGTSKTRDRFDLAHSGANRLKSRMIDSIPVVWKLIEVKTGRQ